VDVARVGRLVVAHRWSASVLVLFAIVVLAGVQHAQTPPAANPPAKSNDPLELVQKLNALRRDYQTTLEQLHAYYAHANDKEKERWAREELIGFHRIPKNAFILDLDVPPPTLSGHQNVIEANKLYVWALQFKDKGWGTDLIDNQRRAEVIFQEILTKYPHSDKISDVAFMLGDIYENKPYFQYYRAVEYYHRCYQWNPKTKDEARIRAARIYDRQLHNRGKAIEMYTEVINKEVDLRRHEEAKKRIAELSAVR
jgi:hypothetical protein